MDSLLKPTLHIEVQVGTPILDDRQRFCSDIIRHLKSNYAALQVGQKITDAVRSGYGGGFFAIDVADYTGPSKEKYHNIEDVAFDVQFYILKGDPADADANVSGRRHIAQSGDAKDAMARILDLPNVLINDAWDSLIYADALPSTVLRYLTRMLEIMKNPGLNLGTFNWNRLCLLHGPPGSGKSTLCRALAQKLSIRMSETFSSAKLVEVNTASMLSKYFGESGKLIDHLFERIQSLAQSPRTLVCVVIEEVESIAGSRERVIGGSEVADGLRATNQLLTALDRLRYMPNVLVLCTSNLMDAIDRAFLDRVDIKQYIPHLPAEAIYSIFRSCFNELYRSNLIAAPSGAKPSAPTTRSPISQPPPRSPAALSSNPSPSRKRPRLSDEALTTPTKTGNEPPTSPLTSLPPTSPPVPTPPPRPPALSSPLDDPSLSLVPTLAELQILHAHDDPNSAAQRLCTLAQKCTQHCFSGRTLRRLPMHGLVLFTWGKVSFAEAVAALDRAIAAEIATLEKAHGAAE